MRVVIIGCGRVGGQLASMLSSEGHRVAIIDRDPRAFRRLSKAFSGQAIEGMAFDLDVLKSAGIHQADAFATVTSGDNTNYVLAALARNRFKVPRVVARIYDPVRADIYRRLGVPTISSTVWGAKRLRELLTYFGLTSVLTIANGEVQVYEAEIGPLLAGHQVQELTVPEEIQVVAIVRAGTAFLPTPLTPLENHDFVHVAAVSHATGKLEQMLGLV